MSEVQRSRTIAAEPEEIWTVLADFGALSSWAGNVDHSCLITEDRSGVGIERRVQMGCSTLVETVISWSPPAELSYEVHGLPRVIRRVVPPSSLGSIPTCMGSPRLTG